MSIQTEIERISGNIAETYAAAGAKGATMPDVLNSDNLPATVASITGGGGAVESVNGMTGVVVLEADDVGAIADEAGAVKTENVADYNITGKKLADQSVTLEKIADSAFETIAVKSSIVDVTLSASDWAEGAYNLPIVGVSAASNQEIIPAINITADQLKALQAANIQDAGQAADSIKLKAFGDVPSIDIPIRVILRGDA